MPPEYHLECPDNCTFKEGTPWSQKATEGILAGTSFRRLVAAGAVEKQRFSLMTLSRHKKHIVVPNAAPSEDVVVKANNIEILETIIQKGFQNAKNWKPTISDTMKAMDMWFRLTQGNPFDELLDTLAAASIDDNDTDLSTSSESDPANGTVDETLAEDDPEG
jgi:hypothetical protein